MEVLAAILIGLGVIVGGVMAYFGLQKNPIPKGLAILHGALVGTGIILLLIYAITTGSHHKHWDSIIIFLIAATGGVYLLMKDLTSNKPPIAVMIVHALIGLGGIVWLTVHLFH
ncbi:MAG: hypothetical protein ACLFPE_01410 [Bacteroidales bacterium]